MKPIPLNDETRALAESLVWFESPAEALADPIRFMAYAFARATHEQMKVLRAYATPKKERIGWRRVGKYFIGGDSVADRCWLDSPDGECSSDSRAVCGGGRGFE